MNRAMKLTCLLAMVLGLGAWALAAEEHSTAVEPGTAAAVAEGGGHAGGHAGTGELVPVSPEAVNQALVQAIWVVVIFLILLAILYPTAWKGVLHGLKAREERIRKEIADAEAASASARQTLEKYNQQLATAEDRVREMLAKAHTDAERMAANIRESAGKEADVIKAKALSDIEDARKLAVAQIKEQAVELSTSIAEKIIRRNLNADDQRELVRASLQELPGSSRN